MKRDRVPEFEKRMAKGCGLWMGRRADMNAEARRGFQQPLDFIGADGERWSIDRGNRPREFRHELFKARRERLDQHACRLCPEIGEPMFRKAGRVQKSAGLGHDHLCVHGESDLSLEHKKSFVFPRVPVERRSASGIDSGFDEGVDASGLFASGEDAIDVADCRKCGAGARRAHDRLWGGAHDVACNESQDPSGGYG